ncbi:membrane protein [Bacterioplanes sanyensis]|uniref:putative sulfate exporter family transporter n=1 Tax=Bacterioplanes sanyensis TaxID=1249553 RepID=UPI0016784058|nr:putative sulfate exporter family transporter [Bacterioplanes sanyensis]GGY47795.1 membrane protein [Bacterioplanes sanyensis]
MTLLLLLAIAGLAQTLGQWLPLEAWGISSLTLALLLALCVPARPSMRLQRWQPRWLKTGIVLFAAQWAAPPSWGLLLQLLLWVTLVLLSTLILGGWLAARLRVPRPQTALLSIGFAVCGGSAIAAAAPITSRHPHYGAADIARALVLVALLGMVNLLIYPWLMQWLGQPVAALVAGLPAPELAQVVIAGSAMPAEAAATALTVKLLRIGLLGLGLALLKYYLQSSALAAPQCVSSLSLADKARRWLCRYGFLPAFILLAVLHWQPWWPSFLNDVLTSLGHVLMLLAVTALGLQLRLADAAQLPVKVILLAMSIWAVNLSLAVVVGLWLSH